MALAVKAEASIIELNSAVRLIKVLFKFIM